MAVERDPSIPWIFDEAFFRSQLETGKAFEKLVAEKLIAAGVEDVVLKDDGFRENIGQISKYTKTSGDLTIKGWPFEVKSRSEVFRNIDDWKYWPMFVDTVRSFDKKEVKPVGYIFVSQYTGSLLAVSTKYKDKWTKEKRWDRRRYIKEDFYAVDKDWVVSEERLIVRLKELPKKDK